MLAAREARRYKSVVNATSVGARWAIGRLQREPLAWAALVGLAIVGMLSRLGPGAAYRSSLAGDLALLAAVAGACAHLAHLRELRALLARARPLEAVGAEACALACSALALAIPAIIWASFWHQHVGIVGRLTGLGAFLVALGHLTAVGLLVARLPLEDSARSVALPIVALGLPALVPREPRLGAVAAWLLEVSRPLAAPGGPSSLPPLAALAPMILCGSAACWLAAGAQRRS